MVSKQELEGILSSIGFTPSRNLSQNFLLVEPILEREVQYAGCKDKHVLEIGPGLGFLTEKLAEKAGKVTAVEKDSRLIPYLVDKFSAYDNVEIVHADFLRREVDDGAEIVVSNVPYSISSPLLFKFADMKLKRAVLCLQKEFADRLVAEPGNREYSRLSVMAGLKFNCELLETVPNMAFYPAPKVHSAIVRLTAKKSAQLDRFTKDFITLVFQHKHKTLRSSLLASAKGLSMSKEEVRKMADSISLRERRVHTLTKEELFEAAKEAKNLRK